MKTIRPTLSLRWKSLRWQVPVAEILYADSYSRHVMVHTAAETYEVVGKLSELQAALDALPEAGGFLRTHQSFLVNMRYIARFLCDSVVLFDGTVIPLSARKRAEALRRYDAWLSGSEQ
ncbi:MAG: LytTR family transcriptional regulator [Clostridia bacterium]|nr:LytTR family transcriptional regulator [Clostridia bacterium]